MVQPQITEDRLSDHGFAKIAELIESHLGIKMPVTKKSMIQSRLLRRARDLGLGSVEDYSDYLFRGHVDAELQQLTDLVTTNKTSFFREAEQFEILVHHLMPELAGAAARERKPLRVLSAGCATGEEVYTLGMVLADAAEQGLAPRSYSITGTDVSTRALAKAKDAVYREADVEPVPLALRKKYLLRGKDRDKQQVRIGPEIRSRAQFAHWNFMTPECPLREAFHAVFFRNVMIYFDRATQERVVSRLCRLLVPGGYLLIGQAETLHGLDTPVEPVGRSVYQRKQ